MVIHSPNSVQDFSERKLIQGKVSLAAGLSATAVYAAPVGINTKTIIRGLVRASSGIIGGTQATVVDAGADTFTSVAHGFVTVTPMLVSGTVAPTGVTAGTIYYAWPTTVDVVQLYDTLATAATHDGSTGLTNPTTAGTAVKLTPTCVDAVYSILGVVANRNGVAANVGSPVVDAFEVISAWACTIAANVTDDTIEVTVTPDATLVTKVEYLLEVFNLNLDAS